MVRSPSEAVLPWAYTLLLVAEVAGLVALSLQRPFTAYEELGRDLGWAGVASMLVMHVYSIRRRVRALSQWGRLRSWLHFHIFMGLQGVVLVLFHSQHLHTLLNMSGLSLLFTLIVVASGAFGRWLYAQIPKGLAGERLSAKEVEQELAELAPLVAAGSHSPAIDAALAEHAAHEALPHSASIGALVAADLRARRSLRTLDHALAEARAGKADEASRIALAGFAAIARRRVMLGRRLASLSAAERLFRNWHILHRPLAYILLGTVILHVAGHYIFAAGMTG